MVICGICFERESLDDLIQIGVKDSKKLTRKKRAALFEILKNNCHAYEISVVSPEEIDARKGKKISLNHLEALKMQKIINILKPDIIYIDAADVNEKRFGTLIQNALDYHPKKIISKHKADDLFPIVSAASILAKVRRDAFIEDLKKLYGDIGSGYPSDKKTIDFLRGYICQNKCVPEFCRKSWKTTKKILSEELYNQKITHFIK